MRIKKPHLRPIVITLSVGGILLTSIFLIAVIMVFQRENIEKDLLYAKEGANKQVISSQADSLIKISRIWADFFPANTSNQPI